MQCMVSIEKLELVSKRTSQTIYPNILYYVYNWVSRQKWGVIELTWIEMALGSRVHESI